MPLNSLARKKIDSGVAQWLACWAHNPKIRGSKPRPATRVLGMWNGTLGPQRKQRRNGAVVSGCAHSPKDRGSNPRSATKNARDVARHSRFAANTSLARFSIVTSVLGPKPAGLWIQVRPPPLRRMPGMWKGTLSPQQAHQRAVQWLASWAHSPKIS